MGNVNSVEWNDEMERCSDDTGIVLSFGGCLLQGQVETDETENGNGKLKQKTETESGNGKAEIWKWSSICSKDYLCACANCVMLGSFSVSRISLDQA